MTNDELMYLIVGLNFGAIVFLLGMCFFFRRKKYGQIDNLVVAVAVDGGTIEIANPSASGGV